MNGDETSAPAEPPKIDPTFRNGTITAFGIIVSFSLGFLSNWASSPGQWRAYDMVCAITIFLGAALQIRALSLLLPVEGLKRTVYDRATRLFLIGLVTTGCGVFMAVAFDVAAAVLSQ